MKKIILSTALLAGLGAATVAEAATITETESITTQGQSMSFATPAAGYAGGTGTLSITLNGDFSTNFYDTEYADVTLAPLGGTLRLANLPGSNYVTSNSISGLSLDSSSGTDMIVNWDSLLQYTFTVSASAMAALLADDVFDIAFDLGGGVNPHAEYDADFVSYSLDYTSLPAVPLPATAPLLLGALGGFGALRRRRKSRG
ncbi:VPLPA-CTERM sorting domain-containing protein [Celeribacter neptunius]|uniref:VPLPA-CTERM protein sorting domain-containing protein n=1 Tax=Celeribacter neptunius TaxID=588602 RepID=A0A1I3QLJ2_9RHOB|nr:VPLPA-CTERM sorting domain-containing protein [Celeribacter neptunius]SFJ34121.1 VPLPA-CTERM protein sorting domain-containing protein [Celeribacter neptunius]